MSEESFNPAAIYSIEAEKAVLASMLAMPKEVMADVMDSLIAEDFFIEAHQEIFDAMIGMDKNGIAIDIMLVHQWLADRKLAGAVGSPGILAEILTDFATHLNVSSYIVVVKEKSKLRRLQLACSTIAGSVAEMPDDVASVMDQAERLITEITQAPSNLSDSTPSHVVMDLVVQKAINTQGRAPVVGITTGFVRLNEYTGGWRPGDMVVLAARPGVGKTALAMAFAHAAASARWSEEHDTWVRPGVPVGILSIEMPHEQLMLRRMAMKSSVPLSVLRSGVTDESERNSVILAAEEMRGWPIFVRDPSYLTISQARSKARRLKSEHGIELLIIDYLQLLTSPSKQGRENRQNEVAEISRGIKGLANELHIPIIILAQLNRRNEESGGRPALHNLRESGAIEQDADIVLLLSADDVDGKEPDKSTPVISVTCDIAKQRNGPCRPVSMLFHRKYTRFDDVIKH